MLYVFLVEVCFGLRFCYCVESQSLPKAKCFAKADEVTTGLQCRFLHHESNMARSEVLVSWINYQYCTTAVS